MRIEADEDRTRLYLVRDRERFELPALWLRERSPDPAQCDPSTHQRLYDPHRLPDDLAVMSACIADDDLAVSFSDGHTVHYSAESLLSDLDGRSGRRRRPSNGRRFAIPRHGERPSRHS